MDYIEFQVLSCREQDKLIQACIDTAKNLHRHSPTDISRFDNARKASAAEAIAEQYIAWKPTAAVRALAREAYSFFTELPTSNGEVVYAIAETAPGWISEMCRWTTDWPTIDSVRLGFIVHGLQSIIGEETAEPPSQKCLLTWLSTDRASYYMFGCSGAFKTMETFHKRLDEAGTNVKLESSIPPLDTIAAGRAREMEEVHRWVLDYLINRVAAM